MIEPWITQWSYLVYRYIHHEPVDRNIQGWQLPEGGPLSNANSALPWIVFSRDVKRFAVEFPQWQIKETVSHTPFGYLLSGGVSFRSFVPGAFFEACCRFEKSLALFMPGIAMFATIVLERRGP